MRVFLAILFFIFSFQSLTKADDINEFEIEGISIGDSLLQHFDEKKIKSKIKKGFFYKNKKFVDIFFDTNKTYEVLQITIKPNDKTFKVHAVSGQIHYEKNIKDCYPKIDQISSSIENQLSKNVKKIFKNKKKHKYDKSGKSIFSAYSFALKNGYIRVECYDWDKKYEFADKLMVTFYNKSFNEFLVNEAY